MRDTMEEQAAWQIVGLWGEELEQPLLDAQKYVVARLLQELALQEGWEFLPLSDDRVLLLSGEKLLVLVFDRDNTRASVTAIDVSTKAIHASVGREQVSASRSHPWFKFTSTSDRFAPIELQFPADVPDHNAAQRERFGRTLAIRLGLPTISVGPGG
jgi:hypothetical protein